MSLEFIKDKIGASSLSIAKRQQDNILYFTNSQVQEDITIDYLKKWSEKNYRGNEDFLNWVKMIFRTENFLTFFKYFRTPSPSASLIQNRVLIPLKRVFHSEDSYFNYNVRGNLIESPELINEKFYTKLFDEYIHNHNCIVIHDLSDVNNPFRTILEIDKVVSIKSYEGVISKIAYTGCIEDENGNTINGYAYIDNRVFAFYDTNDTLIKEATHDLGYCPAFYLSNESFDNKEDVVRKSLFSHVRAELEEYCFLKTLQKMSDAGGVIPIQVMFDAKTEVNNGKNVAHNDKMPMSSNEITGQNPEQQKEVTGSDNIMQPGSVGKVPLMLKTDGSIDSDLLKNFIAFHHTPVEPLKYIETRIEKIEQSIIINLLGDYSEANESAKNELQVSKSYVSKEDRLRDISFVLSEIATKSDTAMLQLAYGTGNTNAEIYFGSDFFIDSEKELFEKFKLAPNPLEKQDIIIRYAKTKNKFSPQKALRQTILYKILPFASDEDFKTAIDRGTLDENTFQLQNRFSYWIGKFESQFGDITAFWELFDTTESEKIELINNLINNIIKEDYDKKANSTPTSV